MTTVTAGAHDWYSITRYELTVSGVSLKLYPERVGSMPGKAPSPPFARLRS
jgi:hypothetical protein